jgi:hypothetical protein
MKSDMKAKIAFWSMLPTYSISYLSATKTTTMRMYFIAALCILASCTSSSSKEKAVAGDTTATTEKRDTNMHTTPAPATDTGVNADLTSLGTLKLEMKSEEVIRLLGEPASKSKLEEWGADGLQHQDWNYKDKGLVLNMNQDPEKPGLSLFSITAISPAILKTSRNIGIGSTYEEVNQRYSQVIDKSASDQNTVTLGSIYGGIILNFKAGKVDKIFVGAAAE